MAIHDLSETQKKIINALQEARDKDVTKPWVSEPTLSEVTGNLGPSVRKDIQLIRKMGYLIPAVMIENHDAFLTGLRGWRIADRDNELTQVQIDAIYSHVSDSVDDLNEYAPVYHPVFGAGSLAFNKKSDAFPKVRVIFKHGSEKVLKSELRTRPVAKAS